MAKVQPNPILQGLSGALGSELVFRRLRDGRTIVCAKPDFSRRRLSAEQQAHHARFQAAAAYARAAQGDPRYVALAAGTMKTPYNVALGDWFHAPVVERIETLDGRVRVLAHDDALVAGVQVTVFDAAGRVRGQGEAVPLDGDWWEYAPSAALQAGERVTAEARDIAGNVGRGEMG
jgi:hypothetical protein